jgi:hypothetical protein
LRLTLNDDVSIISGIGTAFAARAAGGHEAKVIGAPVDGGLEAAGCARL